MKIYTKTGDDGTTGLFSGDRVGKDDLRIACIGEVDELNAALGLAATAAEGLSLRAIQNELFVIGGMLAASERRDAVPQLSPESIGRLEREIDQADAKLPPLRQFILPGGTELAARLHLARTICRRAERVIVQLPAESVIVQYLNRLSDWLFVQARLANQTAGVPDVMWEKD